eukprot:2930313-Pyramimonas_sp.AAC.1
MFSGPRCNVNDVMRFLSAALRLALGLPRAARLGARAGSEPGESARVRARLGMVWRSHGRVGQEVASRA